MYRNRQPTAVNYHDPKGDPLPTPSSIYDDLASDQRMPQSKEEQLEHAVRLHKNMNREHEVYLERAVYKAFAGLDPDLALELRTALTLAPALVHRESKFMDFLRTELYDVQAAAVRIANYWKFRRELFQDRW